MHLPLSLVTTSHHYLARLALPSTRKTTVVPWPTTRKLSAQIPHVPPLSDSAWVTALWNSTDCQKPGFDFLPYFTHRHTDVLFTQIQNFACYAEPWNETSLSWFTHYLICFPRQIVPSSNILFMKLQSVFDTFSRH